eukprot:PhM_4_TR409/c2_g1_i2/m.75993
MARTARDLLAFYASVVVAAERIILDLAEDRVPAATWERLGKSCFRLLEHAGVQGGMRRTTAFGIAVAEAHQVEARDVLFALRFCPAHVGRHTAAILAPILQGRTFQVTSDYATTLAALKRPFTPHNGKDERKTRHTSFT